ncbi:MAG: HAMP domain-containing histidine kinase [Acidimicrobiia bacterium]|nr:HAMP domain-containing histidine kinase [Acidimicrobiia bacterium]
MARRTPGQGKSILIVVAIAAVAAVAAAVFADASQAARVASDGEIVVSAERLSAAISAVRSNLGITLVLVEADRAGVEVEDDIDEAARSVVESLEGLTPLAATLDDKLADSRHRDLLDTARTTTTKILRQASEARTSTEIAAAREAAVNTAIPALADAESAALEEARRAQARIEAEQSQAGAAARASSLVVALIVPAIAAWALWTAARRREERIELQSEVEKNQALVHARDELIAGVSHQLRTPLTAITGYSHAITESPDDEILRKEGMEVIRSQATELTRMIDDLVVMARLEDGAVEVHAQPLDPVPEIRYVTKTAEKAGGRIQLSTLPGNVMVDRLRLRHVLTNIVSNAVRHGGPSIVVKAAPTDRWYRIVVADDGDGLPVDQLGSVFRPYVHSPKDTLLTGTLGLGLAVAKQLADQMHCNLSYERLDGFTLFVLDVPLTATPPD